MIFVVKFFCSWLFPPGCIVLLLLFTAFRLARKGRSKAWCPVLAAGLLLWGLSLRPVAGLLVRPLEASFAEPPQAQALKEALASGRTIAVPWDVIVVLGAGAVLGVPDFGSLDQTSGIMAKSLLLAARLHRATGLPVAVAGGRVFGDSACEADIAVRQLAELGVPRDKLLAEGQSRTTVENARNMWPLLAAHGFQRPLLIAAALHAPRAELAFRREGLSCTVWPASFRFPARTAFSAVQDLTPQAACLEDSASALKEYLGAFALRRGLQ